MTEKLSIALDLSKKGYPVFSEFGHSSNIDLIALVDDVPIKIKVIEIHKKDQVEVLSGNHNEFDILAVYVYSDSEQICAYIPNKCLESGIIILKMKPVEDIEKDTSTTKTIYDFSSFEEAVEGCIR